MAIPRFSSTVELRDLRIESRSAGKSRKPRGEAGSRASSRSGAMSGYEAE